MSEYKEYYNEDNIAQEGLSGVTRLTLGSMTVAGACLLTDKGIIPKGLSRVLCFVGAYDMLGGTRELIQAGHEKLHNLREERRELNNTETSK